MELEPGSSGLEHTSFTRCGHLRVVSTDRLSTRTGTLGPADVAVVDQALRFVLNL